MAKDLIVIEGQEIEMETKVCEGGCGMLFRVMKGSAHSIARVDCDSVCKDIVPLYAEKREKRQKLFKEKEKELRKQRDADRKAFAAALDFCRKLLPEIQNYKFEVAQKVIDVSFLRSDSKEKKLRLSGLSAANFARELGVDVKTLLLWVRIKRQVIDKIGMKVYETGTYTGAMKTVRLIELGMDTAGIKEIFLKESRRKK